MFNFLTSLFQKGTKQPEMTAGQGSGAVSDLDREIEALYGILTDIVGSDKLVIKAGKMDAMRLMRSPQRGERVLALQRIILENPTID